MAQATNPSALSSGISADLAELDGLLATPEEPILEAVDELDTEGVFSTEPRGTVSSSDVASAFVHGSHGLWVRADSLLWWSSGFAAPPLVTTSPVATPPEEAGVIGGDAKVLLAGDGLVDDPRLGGRLAVAKWLGRRQLLAVEGVLTSIGDSSLRWSASSAAFPILARPYFDLPVNTDAAALAAYPDMMTGSVQVDASSGFLATEGLLRMAFVEMDEARIDLLAGYRYQRLEESLRVAQSSLWPEAQGPILAGTTRELTDQFDTRSHFNGIEIGLMYETRFWRCALGLDAKAAVGKNRSSLGIDGSTVTTVPGEDPAAFTGGLLAQSTNMGDYHWEEFSIVTDIGILLACDVTDRLRAVLGYSVLYWPNVARPDNQIDMALSQLPPEPATGANRPTPNLTSSDYWLQGMRFGIELDY